MKNRIDVIEELEKEKATKGLQPMDFDEYSHHMGWIEALEWVLDDDKITNILKEANNETIKKAQKRLAENYGFGQRDDDINIKADSIRDGWLHGPSKCPTGHAEA